MAEVSVAESESTVTSHGKRISKDLLRYSLALNEEFLLKIHACSSRQGSPHQ